jgi:hypothetical protein
LAHDSNGRNALCKSPVNNLSNATIAWSTFRNTSLTAGNGQSGNTLRNVTITRNRVLGATQPISISPTGTLDNVHFTFNYGNKAGTTRFSLEYASGGNASKSTNITVNDNYFVTDNCGISVVDAGAAEIARNFVRRVAGGSPYCNGIEFNAHAPAGSMRVHDNYIRNESSVSGFGTGIGGSYDSGDNSVVANNNLVSIDGGNCTIGVPLGAGGGATVSRTTNVDRGVPPIPPGGAGP